MPLDPLCNTLALVFHCTTQVIDPSQTRHSLALVSQCPAGTFQLPAGLFPSKSQQFAPGSCQSCFVSQGSSRPICNDCTPSNVRCLGGPFLPRSVEGHWLLLEPDGYQVKRCTPATACAGDNRCSLGYTGSECSECEYDYSRNLITGECTGMPGYVHPSFGVALVILPTPAFALPALLSPPSLLCATQRIPLSTLCCCSLVR